MMTISHVPKYLSRTSLSSYIISMALNQNLAIFMADLFHRISSGLPMLEVVRSHDLSARSRKARYDDYVSALQIWVGGAKNIVDLLTTFDTAKLNVHDLEPDLGLHARFQAMSEIIECLEHVERHLGPNAEYYQAMIHTTAINPSTLWSTWHKIIDAWKDLWELVKLVRRVVYYAPSLSYEIIRSITVTASYNTHVFWTFFWEYARLSDQVHLDVIITICTEVIPQIVKYYPPRTSAAFVREGQSSLDTFLEGLNNTDPAQLQQCLMAEGMRLAIQETNYLVRRDYQVYLSGKHPAPEGRRLRSQR